MPAAARLGGPFALNYQPESGAGSLDLELAATLDGALLGQALRAWRGDYDLTAGRLAAQLALRWRELTALNGSVRVNLEDVHGFYQDYRAAAVSATLPLRARDGAWSLEPSRVTVGNVDVGVVLEQVSATLAWAGERLSVSGAAAGLLGGRAWLSPFDYDLGTGTGAFTVSLDELALERVLALEGRQISGTGRLQGTLPVQLAGHRPSMQGGQLWALPPGGVIRLAPGLAAGTGQPGLDFALRALQDFRYSTLLADASYSESGDLKLAVRLEGRNPQVEGGRPIHYNVTVSEHLPTLLEALTLQDRVTRGIEQRVTN